MCATSHSLSSANACILPGKCVSSKSLMYGPGHVVNARILGLKARYRKWKSQLSPSLAGSWINFPVRSHIITQDIKGGLADGWGVRSLLPCD